MKQFYLICNLGLYNAIRRIREKCHEIRVASLACNPGPACLRCGWPLSPALSLWRHNYTASVCVVSLVKVLLSCSRMSTAFCDTISRNTDAISIDIIIRRRETVHCHRRSLCLWAISLPQALQASRQSLMGHHGVKIFDNRKKIDFKQTIIDFQEKTILTSLNRNM